MAAVVVTGGGLIGLSTAMLLAKDGHEVTVLERDPSPPPATPADAWEQWDREGVNQFRLLHMFLPRFRKEREAALPEVMAGLDAAGALRFNPVADAPVELTGGPRPGDEEIEAITARRPVAESVVASVAAATPGVTVRRGVGIRGLLTGTEAAPGIPHVIGVVTESGEEIRADLVIDATGRRSPLATLAGRRRRPRPDRGDRRRGFRYYGRHFRSGDGTTPPAFGPLLQHYDSLSILTLPADNGTWGVGLVTSAKDAELLTLRDVAPVDDRGEELSARRPLARRRTDRRADRRHGQAGGPPPHVRRGRRSRGHGRPRRRRLLGVHEPLGRPRHLHRHDPRRRAAGHAPSWLHRRPGGVGPRMAPGHPRLRRAVRPGHHALRPPSPRPDRRPDRRGPVRARRPHLGPRRVPRSRRGRRSRSPAGRAARRVGPRHRRGGLRRTGHGRQGAEHRRPPARRPAPGPSRSQLLAALG